jgi:DNA-binding NarL/FixJ family response regulator
MAGEFWISRSIVADLLQVLRANQHFAGDSESSALTRRELDIIAAVVEGQVNRDIAQTFQISEYTVKHHLTRIFEKLGVSNRVELAMYAVNHDLVTWSRASSPMKAQ